MDEHALHHKEELPPEARDADIPLVIYTGLAILAAIALCFVVSIFQYKWEMSMLPKSANTVFDKEQPLIPPGPQLQASPSKDLVEFKTGAAARVGSYGWVDKETGTTHVPVDVAIDMALKKGFSSQPGPQMAEAAKAATAAKAQAPKPGAAKPAGQAK